MIRKLVVPVRGDGKGENVLAHAAALAQRFGAHIDVTHCRPRPQDMQPFGIPIPSFFKAQYEAQAAELADQMAGSLREEFQALFDRFGLTVSDKPITGKSTVRWIEESGRQVEVIKRHGRLADLVVVAQPEANGVLGVNSLKAALFHTGRPALMCPDNGGEAVTIGNHVAVAWNGSTESARAVALNLGLLEGARELTILTGGEEVHGTSAQDLADYLALRGLTSRMERFSGTGNVGKELLKRATAAGADTLVMGAYGDNYQKEIAFGGNTQTIIDRAQLPVVLVH